MGLVQIARALLPDAVLRQTLNPVDVDLPAVAVASAAGLLATVAAGLLPAWIGTRAAPGDALRVVDRGGTETRAARASARVLLVGEVALACALLVGATLLVRSFVNLTHAERGLETRGVLAVWIVGLPAEAADRAGRLSAERGIEEAVRAIPGVRRVAFSFGAPPAGGGFSSGDGWLSDAPGATARTLTAQRYRVGADFFELYGIPILRGRPLPPDDPSDVVIVGERFAAIMWPDLDPVGRSFRFGNTEYRVIGLAREIYLPSVDALMDLPEFYEPFAAGSGRFTLSLQCGDACPEVAVVRQRILEASPGTDVWKVEVVEHGYLEQTARPRAVAALALTFAALAVVAAAGGLFAVLSYTVGVRRREFGIRLALGAHPADLWRLVVRDGLRVALAGLAVGATGGRWLSRALATMTYGVAVHEVSNWTMVGTIVMLTTLLAAWRPAARAARVDPVALLREE